MTKVLVTIVSAAFGSAFYWWLYVLDHQSGDEVWTHRIAGAIAVSFFTIVGLIREVDP